MSLDCWLPLERNNSDNEPINYIDTQFSPFYNHGHNIVELFNALPNFLFTTSEMMHNY